MWKFILRLFGYGNREEDFKKSMYVQPENMSDIVLFDKIRQQQHYGKNHPFLVILQREQERRRQLFKQYLDYLDSIDIPSLVILINEAIKKGVTSTQYRFIKKIYHQRLREHPLNTPRVRRRFELTDPLFMYGINDQKMSPNMLMTQYYHDDPATVALAPRPPIPYAGGAEVERSVIEGRDGNPSVNAIPAKEYFEKVRKATEASYAKASRPQQQPPKSTSSSSSHQNDPPVYLNHWTAPVADTPPSRCFSNHTSNTDSYSSSGSDDGGGGGSCD